MNEYATTTAAVAPDTGTASTSWRAPRRLAALGLLGPLVAATLVGALHVLPETTEISPVRRTNGQVHRVAALVAFICLPVAVLLLTRRRGAGASTDPAARCASWLAAGSLGWFGTLVGAWLISPITGTPWYRALPIGLVERALVLCEVAAIVALGVWVITARTPIPALRPASRARTAPAS